MQTLAAGYRGFSVLMNLNWDRILYCVAILGSLWIGSFVGSM